MTETPDVQHQVAGEKFSGALMNFVLEQGQKQSIPLPAAIAAVLAVGSTLAIMLGMTSAQLEEAMSNALKGAQTSMDAKHGEGFWEQLKRGDTK